MKTKENENESESQRAKATDAHTQTERVAEASCKWRFSMMLLDSIAGIRRMWFRFGILNCGLKNYMHGSRFVYMCSMCVCAERVSKPLFV